MSQINLVASSEKRKRSPLSVEIRTFCRRISVIAVIISAIFFFVALVRGRNFNYAVTFAIGILLAWIPQGLPLTVTMLLALAGRRMLQKNVVVKDLHGIETLGAITLLASDKTGTLTKNEMEVTELWVNKESFVTKATPGQKVLKLDFAGVAQLLHIGATCSRARLETVTTDSGVTEK